MSDSGRQIGDDKALRTKICRECGVSWTGDNTPNACPGCGSNEFILDFAPTASPAPGTLTAEQIQSFKRTYESGIGSVGVIQTLPTWQQAAEMAGLALEAESLRAENAKLRAQLESAAAYAKSRIDAHDRMEQQLQHRTLTLGAAEQRADAAEARLREVEQERDDLKKRLDQWGRDHVRAMGTGSYPLGYKDDGF